MTAAERYLAAVFNCHHQPDGACVDCMVAALRAHAEAVREEAANAVPTNWLDPLLSGPERVVGTPPYDDGRTVRDVERLLRAVKRRILAIKAA